MGIAEGRTLGVAAKANSKHTVHLRVSMTMVTVLSLVLFTRTVTAVLGTGNGTLLLSGYRRVLSGSDALQAYLQSPPRG